MLRPAFLLALLLTGCLVSSCRSVADAVFEKKIAPAVVQGAARPESWYSYLPEQAPGFCLCTERSLVWRDPDMNLGYWRGLHPQSPCRVIMEARGDTFILHRHYVWDGMTVGETLPRDLYPTLRHDALYHALKAGASFPRAEADRAFLRDLRRQKVPAAGLGYALVRCFGGLYLNREEEPTLLVQKTSSQLPAAPLPAPTARELRAENPLPPEIRG